MTAVVIGKSSFLARELQKTIPSFIYLSHEDALRTTSWIEKASCVLNFAFPPSFRTEGYNAEHDIDSHLARMIASYSASYIMLSSRMAYGQGDTLKAFNENSPSEPVNAYGKAKLAIESSLKSILPEERLTILRVSNVFGFEQGRASFMGRCMASLAEKKKIIFDMSPQTIRDFIPLESFVVTLKAIALGPQSGMYNLGSGFGTACGEIADKLFQGYGQGSLEIKSDQVRDQFYLDMNKTNAAFKLPVLSKKDIADACISYGRHLQKVSA